MPLVRRVTLAFDVSASNVIGMGATQLVASLLPALERQPGYRLHRLTLPAAGPVADYAPLAEGTEVARYRRVLPNALSRALECSVLSRRISAGRPLLVLGDIPVRHRHGQVVLVHTPHLLAGSASGSPLGEAKYRIARALFRANLRFVDQLVVQTETMRRQVAQAYPQMAERIAVIAQPPPAWLLAANVEHTVLAPGQPLNLLYPAAPYPHKNHALLRELEGRHSGLPVRITLTAPPPPESAAPARLLRWLGAQGPSQMVELYRQADSLVFPSLDESYGLPLVEAMHLGLPILAADRPYARDLCGEGAIYFDPRDAGSLARGISELQQRLAGGWRPDWSLRLARLPGGWGEVAECILALLPRPASRA